MTRSELVDALACRFKQLTQADVKLATDTIIEALMSALAGGFRIEIRGFGSYKLNSRSPRIGRNPKTGALVQVPAKTAPHFKPGKVLQKRVNGQQ